MTSNIDWVTSGRNIVMVLPPPTDERFKSSYCRRENAEGKKWSGSSRFTRPHCLLLKLYIKITELKDYRPIMQSFAKCNVSVCDWYFSMHINNASSLALTQKKKNILRDIQWVFLMYSFSNCPHQMDRDAVLTNNQSNSSFNQAEEMVKLSAVLPADE